MASFRMTPIALRGAPFATLIFLGAWEFADGLSIPDPRWSAPIVGIGVLGVGLWLLGARFRSRSTRNVGLVGVGVGYVVAHVAVVGVELVPALVFLSMLIVLVELRVLADRFASLYEGAISPDARRRIDAALGRAVLRLTVAGILSVVVPILAADLAVAGVVPVTTIPTAIALGAGVVALVVLLALLPGLERRVA